MHWWCAERKNIVSRGTGFLLRRLLRSLVRDSGLSQVRWYQIAYIHHASHYSRFRRPFDEPHQDVQFRSALYKYLYQWIDQKWKGMGGTLFLLKQTYRWIIYTRIYFIPLYQLRNSLERTRLSRFLRDLAWLNDKGHRDHRDSFNLSFLRR